MHENESPETGSNPPAVTELLMKMFPDAVLEQHQHRGDETVVILRDALVPVCEFLRDDENCRFELLLDLTAVDRLDLHQTPRFEIVYHLKSLSRGKRIRLKARLHEDDCRIDSIHHLWKAVDWYERECYDMFGIHFNGHPNLTRILMYEQFEGHPLRKDYPMDRQQPIAELREIEERYSYGRVS